MNFSLIVYEDMTARLKGKRKIDANLIFEASPYPIPIPAGGPTVEIPILVTVSTTEELNLNKTIDLIIGKDICLDVIDPITKDVISSVTALEHTNITYVMGEETANAEIMDGRKVTLRKVRYTEDLNTYMGWKEGFLQRHGVTGVKLLADPCKK